MKKMQLNDFENITIIQTAFLGDVVLTLPLADAIKKAAPKANVTFVTTPQACAIAKMCNSIDTVISYDKRGTKKGLSGIKEISSILIKLNKNLIVAPHKSLRTTLLSYWSKPSYSVSFSGAALSMLYSKRVKPLGFKHETERLLSLLEPFEEKANTPQLWELPLDIEFNDENYVENLLAQKGIDAGDKIVFIAPGSVWETKKWPVENYSALVKELTAQGYKCIAVGSGSDSELCTEAVGAAGISLAGKTNLPQTIILLKKGGFLVTNDSAPTHFAGLAGIPALTIYGPTVPEFGFYPLYPGSAVLQNNDLKCRPCGSHGPNKCPEKHFKCMKTLTPEIALQELIKIHQKER